MISKTEEKEKAIALRRKGLSYREILAEIPVSKSSLSLWLHSVGLSKKQKQRLTEKKLAAMKRGSAKRHSLRMEQWRHIRDIATAEVDPLSKKQRWIAGTLLYWAEGAKEKEYRQSTDIKFSNSDLRMLILFQKWLYEFFQISKEGLRYELYIHEKSDWQSALAFWGDGLGIGKDVIRVYFKRHNPKPKRKNTGFGYHGLIRICAPRSANIVRKIDGWILGISHKW